MSTTMHKPATTPMPGQRSTPECTACLFPHLSIPTQGPQCTLGYHGVFNLILWVLYTGMQWQCVPLPTDPQGKPALHSSNVYRALA